MSSTPEHTPTHEPTSPIDLLARTKRRSAAIHHRRSLGVGTCLGVVLALVLGGLLLPGTARPNFGPRQTGHLVVADRIGGAFELTAAAQPVAAPARVTKAVERAEVSFSLDLLHQLAGTGNTKNQLVSPSSLATALAMLELGAAGSTEQGIAATLQSAGLTASQQAAGWHSLQNSLNSETSRNGNALATTPELDTANAIWIQKHFAVEPSLVQSLSSNFGTGLWQADFAGDLNGATSSLSQWASDHTHGLIRQMFSPGALSTFTTVVLANAVYLHANWAHAFDPATTMQTFHLASGKTKSVEYMSSHLMAHRDALTLPFAETNAYDAVQLPYTGKRLSALVIMPTHSTLSQFDTSLTANSLGQIVTGLRPGVLDLSMPTFTTQSDNVLNNTLSSMGMSQAFSGSADLSNINPAVQLQVQVVEQRASLHVTPQGTTAAATTGVGVEITSAVSTTMKSMVINRPFLFLVRDNATGTILFESTIENPAP